MGGVRREGLTEPELDMRVLPLHLAIFPVFVYFPAPQLHYCMYGRDVGCPVASVVCLHCMYGRDVRLPSSLSGVFTLLHVWEM